MKTCTTVFFGGALLLQLASASADAPSADLPLLEEEQMDEQIPAIPTQCGQTTLSVDAFGVELYELPKGVGEAVTINLEDITYPMYLAVEEPDTNVLKWLYVYNGLGTAPSMWEFDRRFFSWVPTYRTSFDAKATDVYVYSNGYDTDLDINIECDLEPPRVLAGPRGESLPPALNQGQNVQRQLIGCGAAEVAFGTEWTRLYTHAESELSEFDLNAPIYVQTDHFAYFAYPNQEIWQFDKNFDSWFEVQAVDTESGESYVWQFGENGTWGQLQNQCPQVPPSPPTRIFYGPGEVEFVPSVSFDENPVDLPTADLKCHDQSVELSPGWNRILLPFFGRRLVAITDTNSSVFINPGITNISEHNSFFWVNGTQTSEHSDAIFRWIDYPQDSFSVDTEFQVYVLGNEGTEATISVGCPEDVIEDFN